MHPHLRCFKGSLHLMFPALLLVLSMTAIAQGKKQNARLKMQNAKPAAAKQTLTYQITLPEANTFGYDILSDNEKLIDEPSKSGLSVNIGFTKKLLLKRWQHW